MLRGRGKIELPGKEVYIQRLGMGRKEVVGGSLKSTLVWWRISIREEG